MTEQIANGYLVVSAPGKRRYRGADRRPWEVVDAAYYSRTLPDDIRRLYEGMRAGERRGLWWPTTSSREDATRLLEFTRAQEPEAELIAIHSPYLRNETGRQEWTEASAGFLGIDVISVGEWSLLQALAETDMSLPDDIVSQLNDSGLLQDDSIAGRIEAYYRELSDKERVEPIAAPESGIPVEPVRVYLVSASPL